MTQSSCFSPCTPGAATSSTTGTYGRPGRTSGTLTLVCLGARPDYARRSSCPWRAGLCGFCSLDTFESPLSPFASTVKVGSGEEGCRQEELRKGGVLRGYEKGESSFTE